MTCVVAVEGCAAPHSLAPPLVGGPFSREAATLNMSAGYGAGVSRRAFETSFTVMGSGKWFALGATGIVTVLSTPKLAPLNGFQRSAPGHVTGGFTPLLRPTLMLGPVTLSAAFLGFGFGAGGGAIAAGSAGGTLGVDLGALTTIYAGGHIQGYLVTKDHLIQDTLFCGVQKYFYGKRLPRAQVVWGFSGEAVYGEAFGVSSGAQDTPGGTLAPGVKPDPPLTADTKYALVMLKLNLAFVFPIGDRFSSWY